MSHRMWVKAYLRRLDGAEAWCPACARGRVQWRLAGDPSTRMGYAILWCDECGKGTRLSRLEFPMGVACNYWKDDSSCESARRVRALRTEAGEAPSMNLDPGPRG